MIAYLRRSLRHRFGTARTLSLLTITGVALGVASVVAIQILNQGALSSFAGSVRAISGRADLSVTGTVPTFDEAVLPLVLGDPEVREAWPLIRIDAAVSGSPGVLLDIVGTDVFSPSPTPLASGMPNSEVAEAGRRLIDAATTPGWIALTPEFAAERGWSVGERIRVSSGSRTAELIIGSLIDIRAIEPLAPSRLALMDIAWAQALLGRPGRIHQIDVILREGADADVAADRLRERLGPGLRVEAPEQRNRDAEGLLSAFRLNLTALSLISVFVGLFLVFTSIQASLVRRRFEFGVLRSLGATPQQVFVLILVEALLIGAVGVLMGIPVGWLAARGNLASVSATLTNIYVLEGIETVSLPPSVLLMAVGIGFVGSLGGAVLPAFDMARRETGRLLSPLDLHGGTGRVAGRLALTAAAIAAAVTVWFLLTGRTSKMGGFVYGAVMMAALPLVVPLVVRAVGRPFRPRGLGVALSVRNLSARLQSTSMAVAALAVTASMLVGITLLIGSFRATLITWIDETVRADVYVSTESWARSGDDALLDRPLISSLATLPEVVAVEEQRRLEVTTGDGRRIWLNGIRAQGPPGAALARRLPMLGGDPEEAAAGLARGMVLIGEPLARKAGLGIGDTLTLAAPAGPVQLGVAGVVHDYTSHAGTAFVTMATLEAVFGPTEPNNVALFLTAESDVDAIVSDLSLRFAERPLVFRSNATLRSEVLDIFDQTFAVTRTLQAMALLIAVCGVSLTMLVSARERAGELALMRALGATRRQVFSLFLGEGAVMGGLGLLLGLGGGFGLAALLILVVNRTWFGWTIRPAWPGEALALQAGLVLLAAAAAAVYPAFKASLSRPDALTRDDL